MCSLALTAGATIGIAVATEERDAVRFENLVQAASDRLTGRLQIYVALLQGGSALFAASDSITAEEFAIFVDHLDVQRRYPGIQGIGWSQRLATDVPGPLDEAHAIQYLEPLDERNRAAIGYDMYSEEVRREAMQRARDEAEPALSGRVTLVQEIIGPQQPGFLIYVPVYARGDLPPTVQARRAALLGFIYSPFRADDLFRGIFGTEARPRVRFSVFDGPEVRPEALLHASDGEMQRRPGHVRTTHMQHFGRTWTVRFESRPDFERTSAGGLVPLVLFAGVLASAVLFWLAVLQTRARATAERANQVKSDFLATMSHELRTPLNAISGYTDLMTLGIPGPVNEKQQGYLGRINHAQQHLLGLINDVLNFAKLDAGRIEYRREPLCVSEMVAEAVELVASHADERRILLITEGGPDVRALADPEKARQVLLNLLTNAVKFTDPPGQAQLSWRTAGSMVEIAVKDTGIGIPADRRELIFEPFLQLGAELTRDRSGAGLGLSISRELARGMGGGLRVESSAGSGSVFVFTLPRAGE